MEFTDPTANDELARRAAVDESSIIETIGDAEDFMVDVLNREPLR